MVERIHNTDFENFRNLLESNRLKDAVKNSALAQF